MGWHETTGHGVKIEKGLESSIARKILCERPAMIIFLILCIVAIILIIILIPVLLYCLVLAGKRSKRKKGSKSSKSSKSSGSKKSGKGKNKSKKGKKSGKGKRILLINLFASTAFVDCLLCFRGTDRNYTLHKTAPNRMCTFNAGVACSFTEEGTYFVHEYLPKKNWNNTNVNDPQVKKCVMDHLQKRTDLSIAAAHKHWRQAHPQPKGTATNHAKHPSTTNDDENKRDLRPTMGVSPSPSLFNVLQLGLGFFLNFFAFNSQGFIEEPVIESFAGRKNINKHAGYYSLSIIYAVFTVSNIVAAPIVKLLTPKWAMTVAALCYASFQ
ncbi:hypothetical protein TELCIR_00527, partial [Teladorsagia circumcincta]